MVGTSTDTSKTLNLEGTRRMALKNIEAFVKSFSNPPAFAAAAASSAPAALAIVTESARLHEAGQLRCRLSLFSVHVYEREIYKKALCTGLILQQNPFLKSYYGLSELKRLIHSLQQTLSGKLFNFYDIVQSHCLILPICFL